MEKLYYYLGLSIVLLAFIYGITISFLFILETSLNKLATKFKVMWLILDYMKNKKKFDIFLKHGWIDANKETPKLIKDENYSQNVLAICNGELAVMCYCYITGEDGGYVWANCNNHIDGDSDFDDNYEVTHWQYLPILPIIK